MIENGGACDRFNAPALDFPWKNDGFLQVQKLEE